MSSKYSHPDPLDDADKRHDTKPRRSIPLESSRPRWHRRAVFGTVGALGAAAGAGTLGWHMGLLGPGVPGPITPGSTNAATLRASTDRGLITVQAVAPGVVRVRIQRTPTTPFHHSYAVETDLAPAAAQLVQAADAATLTTDEMSVTISLPSGEISARDHAGRAFITETRKGYQTTGGGYRWQLSVDRRESCHGLGERAFALSLRSLKLGLWNVDAGSYKPGADPLYLSIPFYLGHRPDLSYGVFWDNPARGSIDLDTAKNGVLTYQCEEGEPTIYLFSGDGPEQVVQRFTKLTGLMELPPLWAIGYHQSRWSYPDAAAFRSIAKRMRAERIPCDALYFDIGYMDDFRVFTWNETKFPDPAQLISDLRRQGFRSVAIVDPGVKVDPSYETYTSGVQHAVFLSSPHSGRLTAEVWAGSSEFPDFTKPAARQWWSDQVKSFSSVGLSGLWNDMNEPSTFTAPHTLPDDTVHDWEGEKLSHSAGGHAVYGMQMARATRDGLAAAHPQQRPFVISRAGYAGLQRHATSWNGDSLATWDHLQMTIPQLLNLGMSGIAFSGSDTGGFRGDPDSELYLRWVQLSSMTPFFRTHSARTARERNPWSYDAATTQRIRSAIELRYQILPYLYTAIYRASTEGIPIMRPMFFEHPDRLDYRHIDDQFMLGRDLLVAPILEKGARSRQVVLPEGRWYAFDSGEAIEGGRTIAATAGLDLPLYVRAGAAFPTWPVRSSTSEAIDRLTINLYAGSGASTLYEDAGDGLEYQRGVKRVSTLTTSITTNELDLTWAREGSFVPAYTKVVVRILGAEGNPQAALVDNASVPTSSRGGVTQVATTGFDHLHLDL